MKQWVMPRLQASAKRALVLGSAACLVAGITPAGGLSAARAAAPERPQGIAADPVAVSDPHDLLDRPAGDARQRPRAAAQATTKYGLSFVAIPVRGGRLGVAEPAMRALASRIADRMSGQTNGQYTYGMVGYRTAPVAAPKGMSCNLDQLHGQYQRYAKRLYNPPPGFRDTVAVYLTPLRMRCPYAGVALLRGKAIYLNGVDVKDPQRLQDWITAHELGHTLGLEHSASFWRALPGWTFANAIPVNRGAQEWNDYGDYLDLMGQPPRQGYQLTGARFDRWVFNSLSLSRLGVLQRSNLTMIKTSGQYSIAPLSPDTQDGRMLLSIPTVADGRRTFWVLEYRPDTQNAPTMNYPQPWNTRGYGVRVMLAPRGLAYPNFMNRVFHTSGSDLAQAGLQGGDSVVLAGGVRVTVTDANPLWATVSVEMP